VLKESEYSTGYRLYPIEWDGSGPGGSGKIRSGLYPYRLTVVSGKGETATVSGRMIIY